MGDVWRMAPESSTSVPKIAWVDDVCGVSFLSKNMNRNVSTCVQIVMFSDSYNPILVSIECTTVQL